MPSNRNQTLEFSGDIRSIRWLPSGSLLARESEATIECVPGETSTYLPRLLSKFTRATDFAANADFVVPFDRESVRFFPNPEHSLFRFADGFFAELGTIKLKNIRSCASTPITASSSLSKARPDHYTSSSSGQ
jgi:uncharacterized protein with WD repeat